MQHQDRRPQESLSPNVHVISFSKMQHDFDDWIEICFLILFLSMPLLSRWVWLAGWSDWTRNVVSNLSLIPNYYVWRVHTSNRSSFVRRLTISTAFVLIRDYECTKSFSSIPFHGKRFCFSWLTDSHLRHGKSRYRVNDLFLERKRVFDLSTPTKIEFVDRSLLRRPLYIHGRFFCSLLSTKCGGGFCVLRSVLWLFVSLQ